MPSAEDLSKIWEFAQPHWPGIAWMVCAMLIGQVMAHRVFTEAEARKLRPSQNFWWWGRKTLPLHPFATGLLIGLVWPNPEGHDPAWNAVASMMYFAAWGAGSTWMYEVINGLAKKRGIDLDHLPGGDEVVETEKTKVTMKVAPAAKDPDPTPLATAIEPEEPAPAVEKEN